MNRTFLYKWFWRFTEKTGGPWRRIIVAKYGLDNEWEGDEVVTPHGIGLPKGIISNIDTFRDGINCFYELAKISCKSIATKIVVYEISPLRLISHLNFSHSAIIIWATFSLNLFHFIDNRTMTM